MIILKILFAPFPDECCGNVYGICGKLSEDEYGISVDSTLPKEIQNAVLWHEKAHVYLEHFKSRINVSELEDEAEEIAIIETGISPHKFER